MHIPAHVKHILEQLHKNGHEAYIVGGCVRDMILGIEPYDYDITTSAEPEEVKTVFSRTIDTGIEHGTVTVMMDGEGYEITTYRIDGKYLDNRRPDSVVFTKSLEEDLKRRDFTINAMAYNEEEGVIDLYEGQEDLKAGIIRCVGVPEERFNEDGLRMLRALRFAARFGFVIDGATEAAIIKLSHLMINISAERIHTELTKTLCSKNPGYMARLADYGLLEHIIPEFMPCVALTQNHPYHIYDVDAHTYECLKHTPSEEGLRWAVYLHDIGKGYSKTTDDQGVDHFYGHAQLSVKLSDGILKRLKFDNKTRKRVLTLIGHHDYRFPSDLKAVRKAVAYIGKDLFADYLAVQYADISGQAPDKMKERLTDLEDKEKQFARVLKLAQCVEIKDLAIDGNDLMAMGVPRGKRIGEVLNHLLQLVIETPDMNNRDQLLFAAQSYRNREKDHES